MIPHGFSHCLIGSDAPSLPTGSSRRVVSGKSCRGGRGGDVSSSEATDISLVRTRERAKPP